MQDFDALRHRVEETAERLSSAQSERQQEIQSLIAILGDLEEKYSAQEKQFAYYRARLEPLERSNAQLTSLIENLLDLIDRGFGESSLEPLRKASNMASVLLERDMPPVENNSPAEGATSHAEVANAVTETEVRPEFDSAPVDAEPEMATLDDVDMDDGVDATEVAADTLSQTVAGAETDAAEGAVEQDDEADDFQVIRDLMELMDEADPTSDTEASAAQEEVAEVAVSDDWEDDDDDVDTGGVSDLELEEVALSNLEDDIEMSLDDYDVDLDAVASSGLSGMEGDAADSGPTAEAWDSSARFEDVSDAVLELEQEEDATNATDDLPEVVKTAAAAFASDSTTEEVDTLAAIAEAMEKETASGQAAAPAHSDIRSLMLRVEALAKKAEAMRLTQSQESSGASGAPGADQAAATGNGKSSKPEVAA